MPDNDNEELVSWDQIRAARLTLMSTEERAQHHRKQSKYLARLQCATWCRYARRLAGIERDELARRLDVEEHWIGLFELGQTIEEPTVANIENIMEVCGLSFVPTITAEPAKTKVLLSQQVADVMRDPSSLDT